MKKLTLLALALVTIMSFSGCMENDSVVGVEDPSTGSTTDVKILLMDSTSGRVTIQDVSSGTISVVEIIEFDESTGYATVRDLTTGETSEIKVVSLPSTAGETGVVPDTAGSGVVVPTDTVPGSSDPSTPRDTVYVPAGLGTPSFLDFTGNLAYIEEGIESRLISAGIEYEDMVYTEVPDDYFNSLDKESPVSIHRFKTGKGDVYVLNQELVFLFPNSLEFPANPDFESVDSAKTAYLAAVAALPMFDKKGVPQTLKTWSYGIFDSLEEGMDSLNSNYNKVGFFHPAAFTRLICDEYTTDSDGDGMPASLDPSCVVPLPGVSIMVNSYTSLKANTRSTLSYWYATLRGNMEWAVALPYFFKAFSVDPSMDTGLFFTSNPFVWYANYIRYSFWVPSLNYNT